MTCPKLFFISDNYRILGPDCMNRAASVCRDDFQPVLREASQPD